MQSFFKVFIYYFSWIIFCPLIFNSCTNDMPPKYTSVEEYPFYDGTLGLQYSPEKSIFTVWSPAAEKVVLRLYDTDQSGAATKTILLDYHVQGTWQTTVSENIEGKYYTFEAFVDGKGLGETPDTYAKAAGINGKRAQVIDLNKTDPEGWNDYERITIKSPVDAIVYELHVRDLSSADNSGIKNKGKFIGLTETGTRYDESTPTGIDHIRNLGVTHIQLLPSYDYKSIDESQLEDNKFNWGYDPQNYNIPEGGYSTNPSDGATRIREFKQAIQAIHKNGMGVIMDVVYNHTFDTKTPFEQLTPGYFYRMNPDSTFSNASGCGNETASERLMMRKFIVESVKYWAEEYHIDGFRFDLMAIHDLETMNAVTAALKKINPSIIVYGEGWTAGDCPLPDSTQALKHNTLHLETAGAFSDDFRDAVKGHVFEHEAKGFIAGKEGLKESVKFGIVAAGPHPGVDYEKVNYSKAPWAREPHQSVNYVSCHDNHTLWDRLTNCCSEMSREDRIAMHKLANTMVLTSQGIPFLHAGVEMLRTKQGVENSFESPDSINQINWQWAKDNKDVVDYHRQLIELRKKHPAFRMHSNAEIQKHLSFIDTEGDNFVAYKITGPIENEPWKEIYVAFNGNTSSKTIDLPAGNWTVIAKDGNVSESGLSEFKGGSMQVEKHSALIVVR